MLYVKESLLFRGCNIHFLKENGIGTAIEAIATMDDRATTSEPDIKGKQASDSRPTSGTLVDGSVGPESIVNSLTPLVRNAVLFILLSEGVSD